MPFLFLILPLLISCSDSDKFNISSKHEIELNIFYEQFKYQDEPYIYARANLSPIGNADYYYYYWIIDGERVSNSYNSFDMQKKVSYGEHFLKFVLIDSFNDTLSESDIVRVDEPLKITLLSPIEKYKAEKTDAILFQYKISGVDTWEREPKTVVYISVDEEKWRPLEDNFLAPPLNEQVYYWRIKAFTEQDTAFSEIRSVWIKD
jgi:hypothetical protein